MFNDPTFEEQYTAAVEVIRKRRLVSLLVSERIKSAHQVIEEISSLKTRLTSLQTLVIQAADEICIGR